MIFEIFFLRVVELLMNFFGKNRPDFPSHALDDFCTVVPNFSQDSKKIKVKNLIYR